MPHLIVEYSANVEADLDLDGLMVKLRDCAVDTGVFPLGGTRVRAARRDHYLVTDGDPDNAFVHLTARIGHGRDLGTRQSVAEALFAALEGHVAPLFEKRGLGLSFEMVEIDPSTSRRRSNLHDRLKGGS